jgi:hypothetical protein
MTMSIRQTATDHRPRCATVIVLALLLAQPAGASDDDAFWPGARYDAAIPTFETVLGYEPATWIASPEDIVRYFEALQRAAPDRVRVWEYARSWENRPLIYAAVGSARNIARLDEIRAGMVALAHPARTSGPDAERLIGTLPVVVWLGYGVHGNEISSPDAAMLTAYHLLAAQDDPVVDEIREHALVLIDPSQNPDGRNRFVQNFTQSYGIVPDPDRRSAEHDEPWPGGRTNHYLFDLNRDWFALTQPETRGRVRVLQEWFPSVFVDLHEMSGDSTYYFAPEAVPYNPHLTSEQNAKLELFGRNNAKWFDHYGFDYFTREVYDAFYPGYGASWPAYYGAVAMTYEQASPRGLSLLRADGDVLTFRQAVRHHFVASVSTAEAAATNRELLLRDFWRYRKSAIEEGGSGDVRVIVLPYSGNLANVDKLAGLLVQQGAEVRRATAEITSCGLRYPPGSYVVSLSQPTKRLLRNLLDPEVKMDDVFLAEQERRRAKRMGDQIYDVTAWSLPLQFGIEARPCAGSASGPTEVAGPELVRPAVPSRSDARVAYLVPWTGNAAAALLARALDQGLVALSPQVSFTQAGHRYPAGTLVFKLDDNPADLYQRLEVLAAETGAEVLATDTGWVEEGVNFGSARAARLRAPRVALAWDSPTSSYAAGATRFVLERRYAYPVSVIRTATLARADLSRYQTLVLPPGRDYRAVFGKDGVTKLQAWVEAGGTLVAIEGAIDFLAHDDVGLLATERQKISGGSLDDGDGLLESDADYRAAIRPESAEPDAVAGVLLRAHPDPDHWMTVGLPETVHVLYGGSAVYRPLRLDAGSNALRFAGPDELLASGYLWEENRKLLAHKPFVMVEEHGRGLVIGITADPTVRAYLDGLDLVLLNAVLRGPAHARPTWR